MDLVKKGPVWFFSRWREVCAIVFLLLVIFDFIIAPIVYASLYNPEPLAQIVTQANSLSPSVQSIFITSVMDRQHLQWQPLTLGSNGIVYWCFLAILGIASWKSPFNNPSGPQPGSCPTPNPQPVPSPVPVPVPMPRGEEKDEQ